MTTLAGGVVPQLCVGLDGLQGSPPFAGAGFVQVLDCDPLIQAHHGVHPPSTGDTLQAIFAFEHVFESLHPLTPVHFHVAVVLQLVVLSIHTRFPVVHAP